MAITRRFLCTSAALLFIGFDSILVTGCGGGGGNPGSGATYITRDTKTQYSNEALFIAAQKTVDNQVSKEELISASAVREIEGDLATIRSRYPGLTEVKLSGPTEALHSLTFTTEPTGVLAKAWQQGRSLTGVAAVDTLLKRYELDDVVPLSTNGAGFTLRFKRLLNVERARYNLTVAANQDSPNLYPLTPAQPTYNYHLGLGGTRYVVRTDLNGERTYTFVRGYGDCPSGCLQAHTRTVTIQRNGSLTLTETGAPPNGEYR